MIKDKQHYIKTIYYRLKKHFSEVKTPLLFQNKEQLAIAVILSAQCTDERVNQVTPKLFQKFPNIHSLSEAKLSNIEEIIYSTGFYRNKAKNILQLAKILVRKYQGELPDSFNDLIQLPGIGRKTANVIMNVAYSKSIGIVVDTHVRRITNLLHLTQENHPDKIEKELMKILPHQYWMDFSLMLIYFGRAYCIARRPKCNICFLNDICPSAFLKDNKR